MRALLLAVPFLIQGCATTGEYAIPLVLTDTQAWDEIVLEPDGSGDRGLFCVQAGPSILCYFGTPQGRAYSFTFPVRPTDEFLAPEAGS
jgi:hypothetical protein